MSALANGLRVLAAFSQNSGPLSVSELCKMLDLRKSNVSKILSTLREQGWVSQDPVSRKYVVDLQSFVVGMQLIQQSELCRLAIPHMRKLSDATGQSVALTVFSSGMLVHVMTVEGRDFSDVRFRSGVQLPYYASSAGTSILSHADDELIDHLLATRPPMQLTSFTVTDAARFKARLTEARTTGRAESYGEALNGLGGISVPILGEQGKVQAALGLIFIDSSTQRKQVNAHFNLLHAAASSISMALGCGVYPYAKPQRT
jgi:DNA-binding IclR family transcriptional regulator